MESTPSICVEASMAAVWSCRDYWHATFAKHLTHDTGMEAVSSDTSPFFRRAKGQVTGLLAPYIDDTLAWAIVLSSN